MFRRLIFAVMTIALIASVSFAQDNKGNVNIQIKKASPADGKEMYASYCSKCHGLDGKGNGTAASALKTHPTDLTILTRTNNGKFPSGHLVSILQFGTPVPAHGTAEMPNWGPIFSKMRDSSIPSNKEGLMRANNLAQYLETLQVK